MEHSHVLGMVCGYYLSRFDREAYRHLGFASQQVTHHQLGGALGVSPESIKNWRDEFDPIHANPRRGWHNREMYPTRKRAAEALAGLSEFELYELVRIVTASPGGPVAGNLVQAVSSGDVDGVERGYGLRGPTGARAEEAFRSYHAETGLPLPGQLIDRRSDQCGFDFEVRAAELSIAVEVKGIAGESGGIMFTDKEWRTAGERGDGYFLVVVTRLAFPEPAFSVIQNPAQRLDAQARAYTTVQLGWSVSGRSLRTWTGGATTS